MKIVFIINQLATEGVDYDTTLLSFTAAKMGHEVYTLQVEDLCYFSDGKTGGRAVKAPSKLSTIEKYLTQIQENTQMELISFGLMDVIFLRNNPCEEVGDRSWAKTAGMVFCQLAIAEGVLVLNDPYTLMTSFNKMYFQHFPESVRPRTIISRNSEEIKAFFHKENKKIILKPLQGSGGKDVFLLDSSTNLNQIVETINRYGFIIAQEYLPEAESGDIRVIMLNGKILEVNGKFAAMRRVNKKGDIRSNLHAGGSATKFEMSDKVQELCKAVAPKLINDGMFMVGIDIVGDKIIELNLDSPGGLVSMERFEKVKFTQKVIEAIEQKVKYKNQYRGSLPNAFLSSLCV
ncbi:ATP-grasp domain-containing protein [Belliella marina]|uniref:Glutathione synthetase n=1 Tax=Belliella marina TaxID=1644146 RepID=A0ABW4VSV9_9BACT